MSWRPGSGTPRPSGSPRSTSSRPSSATSWSGGRTGCWPGGTSRHASGTPIARSTALDFAFNKKMNRALIHELATGRFIAQHEDALFLGPPGTGKSHLAQALGRAAIHQGHKVLYYEAYALIEAIADAALDGTRKTLLTTLSTVPLLIIDDLGMRKLPHTAAEDLLEIIMRRYERASTLLTSNRPVDDWGKLLGDTAAVTALLDRLLHHGHVLKCGPRSWRTKIQSDLRTTEATR